MKLLLININNARGFIHRLINLTSVTIVWLMVGKVVTKKREKKRDNSPPFTSFTGGIKSAMIADIPGS